MWPFDDEEETVDYIRPDALEAVLTSSSIDQDTRNMALGIERDMGKLAQLGYDPELAEPRSSFWGELFDTLDAPRQGVAGVVDTVLRGDMFEDGVGTGWRRGQIENTSSSDILRRHDIIDNPIARGLVGFGADLLTDPLSWVSFGATATAKVGGKALTEAGTALKATGVERLMGLGVTDILEQDKILGEVFQSISRGQEAASELGKGTAATDAFHAKKLEDSRDLWSTIFKDDEVLGADLFEKRKLRVGRDLPFLGHFQKTSSGAEELISESPGVVGQALREVSKVIKPGRVSVAEFDISDDIARTFEHLNTFAQKTLDQIASAASQIPLAGKLVEPTGKALSSANELLKKTFSRKALIGATNDDITKEYLNAAAGVRVIARERALATLGEEGLRNQDDLKDAWLLIDELGAQAMKRGNLNSQQTEQILRKLALGREVADGDMLYLRDSFNIPLDETGSTAEGLFRQELQAKLADPNIRPGTKEMTAKLLGAFDDLAIEEAEAGIQHGFLEYYVAHKYKNRERNPFARKGVKANFTESRKYDTLSEAFEVSGKVADIDVPQLLESRIAKSLTLRAQKAYATRLMIENSMPQHIVQSLYREAIADPQGPAAQVLKRNKWDAPKVEIDQLREGAVTAKRAKLLAKEATDLTAEEKQLLAMSHQEFADETHKSLMAAGYTPKDAPLPDSILGEIGKEVDIPGGGKMFLPVPVAEAYKETVAARDLFKEKFGNTALGAALVKAADATTSFFKKFVTIPFPAYHAQNILGDRFRQAMSGINAMDPGVQARTASLMAGRSSIRNAAGQVLDKPTLERLIKEQGMSYNLSDYIGAIESFGDMDIDRFLRTKESIGKNIKEFKQKGAKGAAVMQLHDKFQKTFDGFFRIGEVVRRFEAGDSLYDAVRASNEMYFNYRDMTPIEASYFRRFYMFYGYMSKATKSTLTDLVTNPGNLTMQLTATRALAEFFSDPDAAPTAEMADLKLLSSTATMESLSHAVGTTPDGKPIFGRGFAAPVNAVMQQFALQVPRNFTVGELVDTLGSSAKRTLQKQFASANPMVNASAQLVSGKNLYFDKPLDAEFLRKLPSLNALAERVAGYSYDDLPVDLDAPAKAFLKAVPDGKGRLVADPGRMWILMNLIPGLGRATSMAGSLSNTEIPLQAGLLRTILGVNLDDQDPSRTYLSSQRSSLDSFMSQNSIRQQLKNLEPEEEE